jgi:hypothetical protein
LRNRDVINRVGLLARLTHQAKAFDLHEDHLACLLCLTAAEKKSGLGKAGCARVQCLLFGVLCGGGGGGGEGKRERDVQNNRAYVGYAITTA